MALSATIDYPTNSEPPVNDHQFAAFGTADVGAKNLTALLKFGKRVIAVGKTCAEAPNWVVHFHCKKLDANTTYTLELWSSEQDDILQASSFKTPTAFSKIRGIQPIYPLTNATVKPSFVAYGSTDPSYPVAGTMKKNGKIVVGFTLQGPPDYVIQFTNLPVAAYVLVIQNFDNPPSSDTENNITVAP